jgi:hypothetical protein
LRDFDFRDAQVFQCNMAVAESGANGPEPVKSRVKIPQRSKPDLMLANPLSWRSMLGAADAIRSTEEARVHHAIEWRGWVAARGTRTAAADAGDRISP